MKRSFVLIIGVVLVIQLLFFPPFCKGAQAATLCVDKSGVCSDPSCSGCYTTITGAIIKAKTGDVIIVNKGVYAENINFNGKAITLQSINPQDPNVVNETKITGSGAKYPVVYFISGEGNNSVISGLTIANKSQLDYGSGIDCRNGASPTIMRCVIRDNKSGSHGGGVYCIGASKPRVLNCSIIGNSAQKGGGIYSDANSAPFISGCVFKTNSASTAGGAVYCEASKLEVSGSTVEENTAPNGAGIYCLNAVSALVTDCVVQFNTAANSGGGVYGDASPLELQRTSLQNNTAGKGAGVYVNSSSKVSIDDSSFSYNSVSDSGSAEGGALYAQSSSLTISRTIFLENNAVSTGGESKGGGIYANLSQIELKEGCDVKANTAAKGAGIYIYNTSALTIKKGRIQGNASTSDGAGIYADSSSLIIDSADISGNNTPAQGGGICLYSNSSSLDIRNALISQNTANTGAGIYYVDSQNVLISHCTISTNMALNYGGGIYNNRYTTINNSIFWGNLPDQIRNINSDRLTYSIVQGWLYPSGTGNSNADPGFIDEHAGNYYLKPNSPCIDKGDPNSQIKFDKEGIPRPQDGYDDGIAIADIGAYEYVPTDSCTPRASFDCDPTTREGYTPFTVTFDASASGGSAYPDPDDPNSEPDPNNFIWDYGDGSTGTGITSDHVYENYGIYTVSLTMKTPCGNHTLTLTDYIVAISATPTKEVGKEGYPYTSIQGAIDDASDGEHILVHDGEYNETIEFGTKIIYLSSENGHEKTIINGGGGGNIVTFSYGYHNGLKQRIEGFTIKGSANAGIYSINASPEIANCVIKENTQSGIYARFSDLSIFHCIIRDNRNSAGGGIYADYSHLLVDEQSLIAHNTASDGGGIYCSNNSGEIFNSSIKDNTAGNYGGGIYETSSPSFKILNAVISGNKGRIRGGGIYSNSSTVQILHATISKNISENGGGVYFSQRNNIVKNSIIWDNLYNEIGGDTWYLNVTYSDIKGGWGDPSQTHNLNAYPRFIGDEVGSFYLAPDSPCIDTGINDDSIAQDLTGTPRPVDGDGDGTATSDMGAHEYQLPDSCTPRITYTMDKAEGIAPLIVTFDASLSIAELANNQDDLDDPNDAFIFLWEFGDGAIGKGRVVTHTYQYGIYTVSLTVRPTCDSYASYPLHLTTYNTIFAASSVPTREVGTEYPYTSLQEAINDAEDGEVILVHDGIYYERLDFKGKRIKIYSENGPESAIIDGGQGGSVAVFNTYEGDTTILEGFTLQNGSASKGGGVYCYLSSPVIQNCIIQRNYSSNEGGGIYCYTASPHLINNKIMYNTTNDNGGAISANSSVPEIINCLLYRNRAGNAGGGIYLLNSQAQIINATITENLAFNSGGGLYSSHSSVKVVNTIFWDDYPREIEKGSPSPAITHSIIKGLMDFDDYKEYQAQNLANKYTDPLFLDSKQEDFYLVGISPCIDAGDSAYAPPDLENIQSPEGITVDIGAYEHVPYNSCTPRAAFTVNASSGVDTLEVTFNASMSGGWACIDQADPNSIIWDFGDGTFGSEAYCAHTYTSYGFYDVTLTITATNGDRHTQKRQRYIRIMSSMPTREVGTSGYAYTSIQSAIDDAKDGEMILVHDGIYYETIDLKGKGIILKSANGPESTIIDAGSAGRAVTIASFEKEDTVIEGFTIRNGSTTSNGGGLLVRFASPVIKNCHITRNYANYGGGLYIFSGSPQITHCTVNVNRANSDGGGIRWAFSSPLLTESIIERNQAGKGGGIAGYRSFFPEIVKCSVRDNSASSGGGGIYEWSKELKIDKCTISHNLSGYSGGGVYLSSSSGSLVNTVISKNWAGSSGGGIYKECDSVFVILHCTIIQNNAFSNGGGIASLCWRDQVKNSIFWNNTPTEISNYPQIQVTYSCIKGGCSGEGNIQEDPMFLDPETENYYLTGQSPCINAGAYGNAPLDDRESIQRFLQPDMGAYENIPITQCYPRAVFIQSAVAGDTPLTVTFDASNSGGASCIVPDGFEWNFGDGTSATGETVAHTYTQHGAYDVSLTETTSYSTHTLTILDCIKVKDSDPNRPTREVGKDPNVYTHTSIQSAIDAADDWELILVHPGIYYELINFKGKRITLISKSGQEATSIDGQDKGSVVTFNSNEDLYTVLDGFTIYNGNSSSGGGMYCSLASPTIKNCTIKENSAGNNGGGIYCHQYAAPTITNCTIRENSAWNGGGIYCCSASPSIISSTLMNNTSYYGGGISCNSSSLTFARCSIEYNTANCIGGGIYSSGSSLNMNNCLIVGNKTAYSGASGGGIYLNSSSGSAPTTIVNCAISGNTSNSAHGGGIHLYNASPIIINSILYFNTPDELYAEYSAPVITYSDITGGYGDPNDHNIDCDPNFVDPASGDYHLSPNSCCIDAGDPNSAPPRFPADDLDGKTRPVPQGGRYDIGAYEYQGGPRCYQDKDGDLYGDPNISIPEIVCPDGWVDQDEDCNDSDPTIHPNAPDLCDGIDNDCNPGTPDGADESWHADACDGSDADFCKEGIFGCVDGAKICTDTTSDNPELCDGIDNDCNPGTPDGVDEAWIKTPTPCDGSDADLCQEGVYECAGGVKSCADTTPDNPELCDGTDNDCNPGTPDGVNESWHGAPCDGSDADLCQEGAFECASGRKSCTDTTGDIQEMCNGIDDDCNGILPVDEIDSDMDGRLACKDCNDLDPNVYYPAPLIFSLDPNVIGCPDSSKTIGILGEGFDETTRVVLYVVLYNEGAGAPGYSMTDIQYLDPNLITPELLQITLPSDMPDGVYTVSIANKNSCASTLSNALTIKSLCQTLYEGYNLISLPMMAEDMRSDSLYPGAIVIRYGDYLYNNQLSKRYLPVDTNDEMRSGIGYWVYVPEKKSYPMGDIPITHYSSEEDPNALQLERGWNLIGALSGLTTISVSNGTIHDLFEYSDGNDWGYKPVPGFDFGLNGSAAIGKCCLAQGKGYWAYATEPCKLYGSIVEPSASGTAGGQNMRARIAQSLSTEEGWAVHIKAIGMWKEMCATSATVTIGLYTRQIQVPALPEPPCTTISLDLVNVATFARQIKDIRMKDSQPQTWILSVENRGDADPDYCPLLTWDIPIGLDGHLELRKGSSGTGELLVADMKSITSYRMKIGDGKELCVIFLSSPPPCTYYYRDADHDGYGNTADFQCLQEPQGDYTALTGGDLDDTDPLVFPRGLRIGTAEGYPGETDNVLPLEIEDAIGVTGIDITLLYDPNAIIIKEIATTPLVSGFIIVANIKPWEGRVIFSIAGSTGIAAENGIFANIVFDIAETAQVDSVVPVNFQKALVYNENADSCGALTTNGEINIVEEYPLGDLNMDKQLTSADAVIILKIAVGLIAPDAYQLEASDLNKDGLINSADAILTLKAAVEKTTIFCIQPDRGMPGDVVTIKGWNFGDNQGNSVVYFDQNFDHIAASPTSWTNDRIVTEAPSGLTQGRVEVFIAATEDVSNTFDFTVGETARTRLREKSLQLNNTSASRMISIPTVLTAGPCEQVIIPIEVDEAEGIAGMDIIVGFDDALLTPVKAESTSLTSGFIVMMADRGNGEASVSMASASGITSGTGSLVNLIFDVSSQAQANEATTIIIKDLRVYDQDARALQGIISLNGALTIQGVGACANSPNSNFNGSNVNSYYPYSYYPYDYFYNSMYTQTNFYNGRYQFSGNQSSPYTYYTFSPYFSYYPLNSDIMGIGRYFPSAPCMEYNPYSNQGGVYTNQDWLKNGSAFSLFSILWNTQGMYYPGFYSPYIDLNIPWMR